MSTYQTNKFSFNPKAAVEAAKVQPGYYKSLTWQQRLQVANYLNSIVYDYPENEPPKMDKTVFSMRSRK